MSTRHDVDILIVGAGPVGLYGAYYAGVRGLSVAVVDSLSQVGGQVTAMYPEKQIYDIAGTPRVTGRELIDGLSRPGRPVRPDLPARTGGARALGTPTTVRTPRRDHRVTAVEVTCGAVIVTGGIGTFTPAPAAGRRGVPRPGPGVLRPATRGATSARTSSSSAAATAPIDWCLMLEPVAASVTLVHRRARVPGSRGQRRAGARLGRRDRHRRAGRRARGRRRHREGAHRGEGRRGAACGALPAGRRRARLHRQPRARCASGDSSCTTTATSSSTRPWRTNLPGVFAAGDITDYDGKVRLIAVGFGEVATAVNNAAVHIDPDAQLFPGHSTDVPHAVPVPA